MIERDGQILRALSPTGFEDWDALARSELFARATADGRLVATEVADEPAPSVAAPAAGEVAAVLRHERIPFVSYPYEWTFGMLRDAALLQLDLMEAALEEGLILKDATPYNVQWKGAQPTFIDVGSFERLRQGEPWAGYRQFCMQFLFPLMLTSFKGLPHQPYLRGCLAGITPVEMRGLMSFRDRFRRGTLSHVFLHARVDTRALKAAPGTDVKRELREAGFKAEFIKANVRRLERVVRRLEWDPGVSSWSEYGTTTSYDEEGAAAKARFVDDAVSSGRWTTVWDLGCNDGRFSRAAARHADHVVAVDSDAAVVERLYRSLRAEGSRSILPLTMSLADPSPPEGWRAAERRAMEARGRPNLTLCLALIHHVCITDNIPVGDFVAWLAELGGAIVIEFVDREDPMAAALLRRKAPGSNPDYRRDAFERHLAERFDVVRKLDIPAGERTLYFGHPRDAITAR